MQFINSPRGDAEVRISFEDLYGIVREKLNYFHPERSDPDAFCQDMCVRIEKKMGIFPNVSGTALATTAGEAKWFAASVPPSIPVGTQRSFIVAVRRAHNGKVYSFPAIYLNGYQLVYEISECPKGNGCEGNGCDDGCPTTGWYSDSSEGEYDHNYANLSLAPGDEFLAWSPVQQFDPAHAALVTGKG